MPQAYHFALHSAEALEARYRLRDTMKARDSEPYKRALAKQAELRERLVALFDSLRLDALVYPTMRQRPAFVGEPQAGSTCTLSAHSGLPALSMPAGFTADGLPIGVEILGRPFGDARLVALAYALEQSGTRRRPPPTTPRLANGRAPAPIAFVTTASVSTAAARARFSFDPLRNRLGYELTVTGATPERVQAVVLSRVDSTRSRVVHRLSGPGTMRRVGAVSLSAADRTALTDGRLILSLFTEDRKTNAGDARLDLPR